MSCSQLILTTMKSLNMSQWLYQQITTKNSSFLKILPMHLFLVGSWSFLQTWTYQANERWDCIHSELIQSEIGKHRYVMQKEQGQTTMNIPSKSHINLQNFCKNSTDWYNWQFLILTPLPNDNNIRFYLENLYSIKTSLNLIDYSFGTTE